MKLGSRVVQKYAECGNDHEQHYILQFLAICHFEMVLKPRN